MIIKKSYIDESLRETLVDWALSKRNKLLVYSNEISTKVAAIDFSGIDRDDLSFKGYGGLELDDILQEIFDIQLRIKSEFKITSSIKDYFSLHQTDEGGEVGGHLDPTVQKCANFRFNIILKQAKQGGGFRTKEDGVLKIHQLDEGDMCCFRPDLIWHEVTPVIEGSRIIISFGFVIPCGRKMPFNYGKN